MIKKNKQTIHENDYENKQKYDNKTFYCFFLFFSFFSFFFKSDQI